MGVGTAEAGLWWDAPRRDRYDDHRQRKNHREPKSETIWFLRHLFPSWQRTEVAMADFRRRNREKCVNYFTLSRNNPLSGSGEKMCQAPARRVTPRRVGCLRGRGPCLISGKRIARYPAHRDSPGFETLSAGEVANLYRGYLVLSMAMILAALIESLWGVACERKPLEAVARPLTFVE